MDQTPSSQIIRPTGIPSQEAFGTPTLMGAHPHWQYFLAIESDLEATTRYVEFNRANFATYSIEFARLLLAACAEVDVIAKLLCKRLDPNSSAEDITEYRTALNRSYPRFHTIRVRVPRYALMLEPWRDWGQDKTPDWWQVHNNVKHQRDVHFPAANLHNTLDAVAGLWCLLLYYYKDALLANHLDPLPKLFHLEKEPGYVMLSQKYELPDFPGAGNPGA